MQELLRRSSRLRWGTRRWLCAAALCCVVCGCASIAGLDDLKVTASGAGGDASIEADASGQGGDAEAGSTGGAAGTAGSAGLDGQAGNALDVASEETAPAADAQDGSDVEVSCQPVAVNATDVYVDQQFQGSTRTGTKDCPYTTIGEAIDEPISAGVKRVIHVAGSTAGVVYQEANRLLVHSAITLKGEGPSSVTIVATGACASVQCAVHVMPGGTLDGFTVTSTGGNGVVTDALQSGESPVVMNVAAKLNGANGILTFGAAELGPSIVANNNTEQGLEAEGGVVHIHNSNGEANDFSFNGANGINVSKGGMLTFDGGTAQGNGLAGIRFDQTSTLNGTHTINHLDAGKNNNGVALYGGSLTLRGSKLEQNMLNGLFFTYTSNNQLDLGTATDLGMNVFGGATAGANNNKAGIFLCNGQGPGTVPAEGNTWAECPPTALDVPNCNASPLMNVDVAYTVSGGTGTGTPVTPATCGVGP